MNVELDSIIKTFGLDEFNNGTDKGTIHSYIEYLYQPLFNLHKPFTRIIEKGVFHGGSLVLWKEAFPTSEVYGVDLALASINNDFCLRRIESQAIKVYELNAYEVDLGTLFDCKFDLIIDDGPHTIESQIHALKFIELLSTVGTLVIEDVNLADLNFDSLLDELEGRNVNWGLINLVLKKGRYDDVAIVISNNPAVKIWAENKSNTFLNFLTRKRVGRKMILLILPLARLKYLSKKLKIFILTKIISKH